MPSERGAIVDALIEAGFASELLSASAGLTAFHVASDLQAVVQAGANTDLLRQAVRVVGTVPEADRGHPASILAPRLVDELWVPEALEMIDLAPDRERAQVWLRELSVGLARAGDASCAIECLERVDAGDERDAALKHVAAHATDAAMTRRAAALAGPGARVSLLMRAASRTGPGRAGLADLIDAMNEVQRVEDADERWSALSTVGERICAVAPDAIPGVWHDCLRAATTRGRASLLDDLGALARMVTAFEPELAAGRVANEIVAIGRWYP